MGEHEQLLQPVCTMLMKDGKRIAFFKSKWGHSFMKKTARECHYLQTNKKDSTANCFTTVDGVHSGGTKCIGRNLDISFKETGISSFALKEENNCCSEKQLFHSDGSIIHCQTTDEMALNSFSRTRNKNIECTNAEAELNSAAVSSNPSGGVSDCTVSPDSGARICTSTLPHSALSDSNMLMPQYNELGSDSDVVIQESNVIISDSSVTVPEASIRESNLVISDVSVVIPDSDSISQFSVDTVNCESLEIASTCSIPDMSEYLPCEEVMSFQSETDIQNEVDIANDDSINNEIISETVAHCPDERGVSHFDQQNRIHVDTKIQTSCHLKDEQSTAEINTSILSGPCAVYDKNFQSSCSIEHPKTSVTSRPRIQDAKIVTSNGKQYLKYLNPGENVNILIPVEAQRSALSENDVEEFISLATDISTGSNVEVSTAGCHSSVKKAEKRERDRINKRLRRMDPGYRAITRERTKEVMKHKRADESFRNAEREKDRIRRAEARRTNKALREREKARDRMYQYCRRKQHTVGGSAAMLPMYVKKDKVIRGKNNVVEKE